MSTKYAHGALGVEENQKLSSGSGSSEDVREESGEGQGTAAGGAEGHLAPAESFYCGLCVLFPKCKKGRVVSYADFILLPLRLDHLHHPAALDKQCD